MSNLPVGLAILLCDQALAQLTQLNSVKEKLNMKATLCKLSDIPAQGTKTVDFFGREALLMNVGGSPRAVQNICMHLGGPMKRQGHKLVCEWHGAEFRCGDGKCLKGPARPDARLILLPIRVEEDVVSYVYGE